MSPTKGSRKSTLDWWQTRLKVLDGFEKEANSLYTQIPVAYEVGPQAVSKLALLAYYVRLYTDIIKDNFKTAYYVDYFAGSGLTKIDSSGHVILGSALIAKNIPREGKKFDRCFLFETNPEFVAALRIRFPSAEVFEGSVNDAKVEDLLGKDTRNSIPTLGFVDPEGMDVNWSTLEKLLERWSDVIINFQPSAVRRAYGRRDEESYARGLTTFFGTADWQKIEDTDAARLNLYTEQIHRFKSNVIATKVTGRGGYFYCMILAVKETKGKDPWLRAIYDAKERIESTDPKLIENLLSIHKGVQATL